jgi:hypothetical protein
MAQGAGEGASSPTLGGLAAGTATLLDNARNARAPRTSISRIMRRGPTVLWGAEQQRQQEKNGAHVLTSFPPAYPGTLKAEKREGAAQTIRADCVRHGRRSLGT